MARRAPRPEPRKPTSFAALARELHSQSSVGSRMEVVQAHARKLGETSPKAGHIMVCRLSNAELRGEVPQMGSLGKVIYDDWASASKAAAELYSRGEGRQYPYLCERTKDGHHHLTSKAPWHRFDHAGGAEKPPAEPRSFHDVLQLLSYEITMLGLRPPGDVMSTGDDSKIHKWYTAEAANRWGAIRQARKKGTK